VGIFSGFSHLIAAILELVSVVRELVEAQRQIAPATARLDTLERERHNFEAMAEGLLLKAEGKHKAANNAEARERALKRSYEKNLDAFDLDGEEGADPGAVLPIHVATSESERLSPVRLDVAPNNKAAAVAAKWAR